MKLQCYILKMGEGNMSFEFDALKYSYASRRRLVYGRRGMVSTSPPLAAQAGLDIIKKGGNAVDAAIATAIVYCWFKQFFKF